MLLKCYTKEIFNNECMPGAISVQCFAHLDNDVSEVLPYLNTALGGFNYIKNPPSVTFKAQGKLITIHSRKIAVNALKDEAEAEKIISWLQKEINDAWNRHDEIEPNFESSPQPVLFEILKLLPKTNCKECNEPTCMVFAARVTEGVKDHNDCPTIETGNRNKLKEYLSQFHFE
jgi:ArsR family metal-binding transcriptional regulator